MVLKPEVHISGVNVLRSTSMRLSYDNLFFFPPLHPAEVYPVRRGLQIDPTKRGGRWESDFIWNSNWQDALDYDEALKKQVEDGRKERKGGADTGKGYLSLRNKVDLNSMDVDLSAQLKPRRKQQTGESEKNEGRVKSSAAAAAGRTRGSPRVGGYPAVPATRGEVRTWDRGGRYARKPIALTPTAAEEASVAAQLEAERERYEQLKQELGLWAAGLTAVCFSVTFAFYGRDIAASYGVGALGGLFYLRLLNRSVDSFGVGGLGGALGQNRLLIPIILALGYNRYNILAAEHTGLTLQFLPILVGFFTYKGAVIARQSLALFSDLSGSYQPTSPMGNRESEDGSGHPEDHSTDFDADADRTFDVTSVDRAFNKKILMQ